MSGSEQQNALTGSSIDPLKYLGRDLRELPDDEVNSIIGSYGTLRNTADGYVLGQALMALRVVKEGAKNNTGLQSMLDEADRWIFKGSKATQEKNHSG